MDMIQRVQRIIWCKLTGIHGKGLWDIRDGHNVIVCEYCDRELFI